MRLLFTIDTKDYNPQGTAYVRPSVRSIIIRGGKVAMVHSLKYDYYKFPGGGIEPGETHLDALLRETREETGLMILPSSVAEYGYVHRVQKSEEADMFIQDNYYYLAQAEDAAISQELDDYEADERFTLEFIAPETAIHVNRELPHGPKDQNMLEREAKVLEYLMAEGLL